MNTSNYTYDTRIVPSLDARGERSLVRHSGSKRYLCFTVTVPRPTRPATDRLPVHLAMVIDRSGSMQGEKLVTAKRAALAALDSLDERDKAALVVFDDRIDTLQPLSTASKAMKSAVREALHGIEARGSTALHDGWLSGCAQIAGDSPIGGDVVTRCFLLTDGQANVGESDPELLAVEVGDVLAKTAIVTSTFGIGDYNEHLLAPMATAGGGQFHHLRSSADIMTTFLGELGDVMAVACRRVRLEVEADAGTRLELVSDYRSSTEHGSSRISAPLGDLMGCEERRIVIRASFAPRPTVTPVTVRARLCWQDAAGEHESPWQVVTFTYAGHQACDAERERRDPLVMHWVGLHSSYRAEQEASKLFSTGDMAGAQRVLRTTSASVAAMAPASPAVQAAASELLAAQSQLGDKELPYQALRRQKGFKDHRSKP
jgi:Ca-activated chloride channel homolog